jgi:formylglycine-generating enzyme required for sulfatase activity
MKSRIYRWRSDEKDHEFRFEPVPGTNGAPYGFGFGPNQRPVEISDFYMSATPVTQELWAHVMGANPSARPDLRCPVENVSWEHITSAGGFLDRINDSEKRSALTGSDSKLRFRLPSETEWEYAARGGPRWQDGFRFSGSNNPDEVAWYGRRWSGGPLKWELMKRLKRFWISRPTRTHDVATKLPNQLGIYDMSGNVWEWCQDLCTDDLDAVPRDGTPWLGSGTERRLRGGCHHNWDIHCTVWWRYGIVPDAHDGCIGFRLALS